MSMKFVRILTSVIVIIFCTASVCSANVSLTSLGDSYYVSGRVEGVADNILTIKVANDSTIAHVSYIPLDSEGNFTYGFRMAEHIDADIYNVEIWGNGVGKVFEENLEYANTLKKEELIGALNNANTAEKAKAVVDELIRFRLISLPDNISTFGDSAKTKVYERICEISDFTLENYVEKLRMEIAVAAFQTSDKTTISSVVDLFGDIFNFKLQPLYSVYQKANKQKVLEIILKNDIKNLESIMESFNKAVVLNEINSKDSPEEIVSVMEEYAPYIPAKVINLSKNKMLKMALKLVEQDVYTMEELEALIPTDEEPTGVSFAYLDGAYYVSGRVEGVVDSVLAIKVANDSTIAHVSYIPLDLDGNFAYGFRMADSVTADQYRLEIWGNDVDKVFEKSFEYADILKRKELIGRLNNADTVEKAKAVVDELVRFQLISLPDNVSLFGQSAKSKFYNRICEISDFDLENYENKIQTEIAVAAFQAADKTTVSSVVDLFNDIFNFESEPLYDEYQKADKQKVLEIILKNDIKDLESIKESFNKAVVLNEINSKESHGAIISTIGNKKYAPYIPKKVLNLPEDKMLKLALKLIAQDVYTMEELEALIPSDDDASSGSGSSSGSGGGRTGKTVVRTEVVVDQELVQATAGIESFADIADAEWARTAIEYLLGRKVISGYEDGDFRPNNNITREEFVKLVCKAFDVGENGPDCGFIDVDKNHWAYGYICAAKEKGIIKGISDTLFGIGNNITRQDMAVIIANVLKLSEAASAGFTDEETIADYAKPAVNALKNAGIISGYEDGSFRPYNFTTRAEAAQILYKVLQSK